jgi:hypothetical protein
VALIYVNATEFPLTDGASVGLDIQVHHYMTLEAIDSHETMTAKLTGESLRYHVFDEELLGNAA